MPIVKIYGLSNGLRALPSEEADRLVLELSETVARTIAGVSELKIDADQVSVFVIADHNPRTSDVIVEVVGLTKKPDRTHDVIQEVARVVNRAVGGRIEELRFPRKVKLVEVFVYSFDPVVDGFSTDD